MDIVIYEDDYFTSALLKQWLSEAGYRVRLGSRCEADPDAPTDLVIVNISMPKQGGVQCVLKIQKAHPGALVIAISGQFRSGLSAAGAAARSLGVQQVIAKPLVRKHVLEAVHGMIGGPE
jgi:DNA-binding NtrC family response regulator